LHKLSALVLILDERPSGWQVGDADGALAIEGGTYACSTERVLIDASVNLWMQPDLLVARFTNLGSDCDWL
jgi:hypothetical protein